VAHQVAQSESILPRFQDRLRLQVERLALSWRARRSGLGPSIALRVDDGLVRVDDGTRQIAVPHGRSAVAFRDGITRRLESVAEKYLGTTAYTPRAGDIVIDIGAGIGAFAMWCAEADAEVIAFEPDPLAFACLERNTAAFGRVQIFPYALWKERANLRLHGSLDTSESSLIEDGKASARNSDAEAWPLDGLPFITKLAVIDLMKIDGEGVEPEIIAGATRTLIRTRVVAVDVASTARRRNLRQRVEEALTAVNFRAVPNDRPDTILALNTLMVGPFNNRVLGRRGF
jgi:FkbM family methyltransferase